MRWIVWSAAFVLVCGGGTALAQQAAAGAAGSAAEGGVEAVTEAATGSETVAQAATATDAETETGTVAAAETGTETGAAAENGTGTETEAETGTEREAENGTEAEAEPVAASGAESGSGSPHGHGGIELPAGLALHGRFDLSFEHGGYQDHPFQAGEDRFRNDHHFLFVTREVQDDPFTLNVEVIGLEFFEVGAHLARPEGQRWALAAKAGKVMVPFGAEPHWHNSYGGKAGFDNELLPPVFSELGAALQGRYAVAGVRAKLDLYSVQGYRLRAEDQELNLQSDFASSGDPSLAFGGRLGLSLDAFSVRYSGYYNRVGFGRALYLQALDLELWRMRDIPVLEYLTIGAGALRADVSGAGAGEDYYHFGSYFTVRAYPFAWLYLQYRQGLQSFGNRRGDYLDETRLTAEDGSTHNVGLVARYQGLSAGLYHFWQLEEADEVDDDFTRLSVAYDF